MTQATMEAWMNTVQERSRRLEREAVAKGMDAPRSRCHGTFIHYSNGVAWCLSCYSQLKRGWPDQHNAADLNSVVVESIAKPLRNKQREGE